MIAETLVIHGGDLVEWCETSGYVKKPPKLVEPACLRVEFTKAPTALRVYHKPNGTLLWHKESAGPSKVVEREASNGDLVPQPTTTFVIEGTVSDPRGLYLPRTFAFILGNASEHKIALYLSPLGARFSKAGGIFGQLAFDDGNLAAWALIYLTVTPLLGAPLKFVAQADGHGEFRMPLDRLPALTKDAPSPTYGAKMEVMALPSSSPDIPLDPGALLAVKVAKGKTGGKSQFVNSLNLAIAPGKVAKVVSPDHTLIVIKPS